MIELRFPVPPSTNALYINRKGGRGKGRIPSRAYKAWLREADGWFLTQKRSLPREPLLGQIQLEILVPATTRADITNLCKALEDFLVSREITGDDKNNWAVSIKRDKSVTCCIVKISLC